MTKKEVIKQAYGDYYDGFKEWIDTNGWIDISFMQEYEVQLDFDLKTIYEKGIGIDLARPKSLKGIETNNGWIKIESEQDLPKSGYYDVVKRDTGEMTKATIFDWSPTAMIKYFSHYQPILEREKPLY